MKNRIQTITTFTIATITALAMGLAIEPVFAGSHDERSELTIAEVAAEAIGKNRITHFTNGVIATN